MAIIVAIMDLTGVGLYTFPEASRFTQADPRDIRRWVHGYRFGPKGATRFSRPLWEPQVEGEAIGFRDLLEIRFVKEFVRSGVHLSVVRAAIRNASELFGTAYPLTTLRFLTDGKRIFHEALEAEKAEGALTDVAARQYVFDSIIRPALYVGIEYHDDGSARRWFPLKNKAIVLDPRIGFGAPVLTDYGVPIDTIAAAVVAEGSVGRAARLFDVPRAVVSLAMRFEQRLPA